MASASAMADALAASPRAQGVVSIRGLRGADEGWSYVVHVSGGIAATVGTEPDLRAAMRRAARMADRLVEPPGGLRRAAS